MAGAHHTCHVEMPQTYGRLFAKYLRTRTKPNRVKLLFKGDKSPLDICGHSVEEDPLRSLPAVLSCISNGFYVSAIHGDLHLSNVVVSRGRPHLIDYAWARLGDHVAKDYVLMESSLRFMCFPRHIHPSILLNIDLLLNSQWRVDGARDIIRPTLDGPAAVALTCMLDLVEVIRKRFELTVRSFVTSPDEWINEYFICLYLILAGQQRFSTFPLMRTVVNLNQLRSWVGVGSNTT
jgi:hypothetical protein